MSTSETTDPALVPHPPIYQLAYCSVLKQALDEPAIKALVANAQAFNRSVGITGLLMVDQGLVVQWMEGEKQQVRALWGRIQRDPRHHCVVELVHLPHQDKRLFANWSMQRVSRAEIIAIVHQAELQADRGYPNPWAPAIERLCALIDPDFAPPDAPAAAPAQAGF